MTNQLRRAGLVLVLTLLLCSLNQVGLASTSAERAGRTTITLTVIGCDGCRIQPVQNKRGAVTYWGRADTAQGDPAIVEFKVPTARTAKMAFLVYAPFDEYTQGGIPSAAVVGFRGVRAGTTVSETFASKARYASGCWAGTSKSHVRNTLVVRRIRASAPLLGPGKHDLAAVYLKRTVRSLPYFVKTRGNALHPLDPSICE